VKIKIGQDLPSRFRIRINTKIHNTYSFDYQRFKTNCPNLKTQTFRHCGECRPEDSGLTVTTQYSAYSNQKNWNLLNIELQKTKRIAEQVRNDGRLEILNPTFNLYLIDN
jgi:hypothetical protein